MDWFSPCYDLRSLSFVPSVYDSANWFSTILESSYFDSTLLGIDADISMSFSSSSYSMTVDDFLTEAFS